jgi:hypothetical protein
VVLEYVAVVPNLRDEEDLQCLLFLADEFALLRPNPFYFSVQHAGEMALPCSLVLSDTLSTLLDRGLIVCEGGNLHAYGDIVPRDPLHSALAWLAALSPIERYALAQAALALRTQGVCAQARSAREAFRQALCQTLERDAVEALLRQLSAAGVHG